MRRIMYKVYVGKCTVRQDMKPASQSLSFFLSFLSFFVLGEEKKIIIRRNIPKSEKKGTRENTNFSFFCHKCNILPSYLS